ncbi:hypothetical protein [Hymenobacter sp. BT491]|nr:hypothetical protein [Hymenobacter sp. BT491]
MNLPGLKPRPKKFDTPPDNYARWGWYIMGAMAVIWILYNLLQGK